MTTFAPPPTTHETRTRAGHTPSAAEPATNAAADPRWARPALYGLLLATAVLYLWGLGASGWANSFYSAAVQAGSESWKAFFFGSSDASNAITVDKTPLSLWPMALSVKIFGLSSWSILVPQALEGVATVALVHRLVRRASGSAVAGLVAGSVMALTPVAVLMFRFNNPDALLVLLLVGAAGATLRAVSASEEAEGHPARWLALGGALVGLAFLTKMLQAFLVLPALALVYLFFARTPLGKRLLHLLVALGSVIAAAGWWIAIVELWPASSRPWIGGSQNNSILELTLGYNGLGRLNGNETGSVGGGGQNGGQWGSTGITRLFSGEIGGQIAWVLPASLVLGCAALWFARRDRTLRAALVLWLGVLISTAVTFSFMAGIFHAYYTVALAPGIAALVGLGGHALWTRRNEPGARAALALATAVTGVLAFVLLGRSADFLPWLRPVVLIGALIAAGLQLMTFSRRGAAAVAALALATSLAGPAAYAVQTAGTAHTGSIPTAGPTVSGGAGGFGGRGGFGGGPAGGPGGVGAPPGGGTQQGPPAAGPGTGGGAGGLLNGSTSSTAINALLEQDAADYTWAAAAVGSNTASGYQLATELPVMAIGGFNGSDPSPTLEQFEEYVAAGRIHWFIGGGGMGGGSMGGSNASARIAAWVAANFTATTVDGVTLYDLSGGVS